MLERMIGELRLDNVQMAGAKVGQDLIDQYRWADAFVLTSIKESTGIVLLEAIAAGLPVVATNVVGVRDTVGDDGLLVAPDPAALRRLSTACKGSRPLARPRTAQRQTSRSPSLDHLPREAPGSLRRGLASVAKHAERYCIVCRAADDGSRSRPNRWESHELQDRSVEPSAPHHKDQVGAGLKFRHQSPDWQS